MYLPECEMTFHLLKGSIYLINYQRKGSGGGGEKAFFFQILPKESGRRETNSLLTHEQENSSPREVTPCAVQA